MELLDIITQYGWKALLITILVLTSIELLKPLLRRVIKNEQGRHSVYVILNYLFTLLFTTLLVWMLGALDTVWSVYGASIIVVNISYPIVANVGFIGWIRSLLGTLLEKTSEGYAWRLVVEELSKQFGIDSDVLDKVATKIEEEYFDEIKENAELFFTGNKEELVLNIKQKLAGFISNDKLQEIADTLYIRLKESWLK